MNGQLVSCFSVAATLTGAFICGAVADAATVTKQVLVSFDGSLAGTAYTLAPGEIDNSGTFQGSGSATIAGGVADIPGDTDDTSGFYFDGTSLGLGSLQTENWIVEAIVSLDTPVADQPNVTQPYNHFLDIRGDTFYRFNGDGNDPKVTQFGYWDGASEPSMITPDLPAGQATHVALVWDATTNSLEAFQAGVSQGTLSSGNPFEVPSPDVGYGFFARFQNRAIDGKLDAVAFSTYEGTFDRAVDFQLPIPEPSSLILVATALVLLRRRVRW